MGSGYGTYWADVMTWDSIKTIVPDEAAALEQELEAAGVSLDDFCASMLFLDLKKILAVADEDAANRAISQIEAAWQRLADSFKRATAVDGSGLELHTQYQDPDNTDFCNEVDGGFFHVEGAYQLSPAGTRYIDRIQRVCFVARE